MPEVVGRLRPPRLAVAPAAPVFGELYYDTARKSLMWWNGTTWIEAGTSQTQISKVSASETTNQSTFVNMATVGPSVTAPSDGGYIVEHGAYMRISAGTLPGTCVMSYQVGATAAVEAMAARFDSTVLNHGGSVATANPEIMGAGTVVTCKYRVGSVASTALFANRWITLTRLTQA